MCERVEAPMIVHRVRAWCLSIALLGACGPPAPPVSPAAPSPPATASAKRPSITALVDVTVVSPRDGRAREHQVVLIEDGRIAVIGDAPAVRVPAEAHMIAGAGRFVVPGFVDMHVHLPAERAELERVLELSLAHGITTIRGMQGAPGQLEARAQLAAAAARPTPTLVLAGPPVSGALTAEGARALVREQKRAGYDQIKLLGAIDRAAYDALVAEAATQQLPVVGHVPAELGLDAALGAHQRTIEHLNGYTAAAQGDPVRAAALARRTRDASVWNCPTLDFLTVALGPRDHLAARAGIASHARDAELTAWNQALADRPPPADGPGRLAALTAIVVSLRDAGAPIVVGSDTPDVYALPGFAYLEELRALTRAGLSPLDVLRAATTNARAALGLLEDLAPGASADLVLLDRDPRFAVEHLAQPAGVMVRGRWLARADLNALLATHRTR